MICAGVSGAVRVWLWPRHAEQEGVRALRCGDSIPSRVEAAGSDEALASWAGRARAPGLEDSGRAPVQAGQVLLGDRQV